MIVTWAGVATFVQLTVVATIIARVTRTSECAIDVKILRMENIVSFVSLVLMVMLQPILVVESANVMDTWMNVVEFVTGKLVTAFV